MGPSFPSNPATPLVHLWSFDPSIHRDGSTTQGSPTTFKSKVEENSPKFPEKKSSNWGKKSLFNKKHTCFGQRIHDTPEIYWMLLFRLETPKKKTSVYCLNAKEGWERDLTRNIKKMFRHFLQPPSHPGLPSNDPCSTLGSPHPLRVAMACATSSGEL